jgi:hypothetical protein
MGHEQCPSRGVDPEHGRLTVGEEGITAFTRFGIDNLAEIIQIYKENPNLLPRPKPPE